MHHFMQEINAFMQNGLRAYISGQMFASALRKSSCLLCLLQAAAVPFGIAVVLLWLKYERCVNESVDGGVFR